MSMMECDNCGALVDTDDVPQGYVEEFDTWLCDNCNDNSRVDYIEAVKYSRERARLDRLSRRPE